jgi:hypothetical protein
MTAREFFYKTFRDLFGVSFTALVFFSLLEWFQPGFVSFYISFNLLLIIPLISGILTILLDKQKIKE